MPNPDSRVTLSAEERDRFGQPRAVLDWRLSPLDKRTIGRAQEIIGQEMGRAGFGRVRPIFADGDAGWPESAFGGNHHMGTTRMHEDPREGVVDPDCRVHGLANLYVAGSSVFPTGGSQTTTFTLVALALRLADHLKAAAA